MITTFKFPGAHLIYCTRNSFVDYIELKVKVKPDPSYSNESQLNHLRRHLYWLLATK